MGGHDEKKQYSGSQMTHPSAAAEVRKLIIHLALIKTDPPPKKKNQTVQASAAQKQVITSMKLFSAFYLHVAHDSMRDFLVMYETPRHRSANMKLM